jgi:hypothetical protein
VVPLSSSSTGPAQNARQQVDDRAPSVTHLHARAPNLGEGANQRPGRGPNGIGAPGANERVGLPLWRCDRPQRSPGSGLLSASSWCRLDTALIASATIAPNKWFTDWAWSLMSDSLPTEKWFPWARAYQRDEWVDHDARRVAFRR